jgi:hypothetical protein
MSFISEQLEKHTCENSSFETARNYISLSHIHLEYEEILKMYHNGFDDSKQIRLRCYKGYQMEADLKRRIVNVFPDRIKTNIEISLFGGLVQGHPDFEFDGYPADCKTVPMDEHLPREGKVSRKIYSQMQAYMLYTNKPKALLIYESRETGIIIDIWLRENKAIQQGIDDKINRIVSQFSKKSA